MFGVSGGELFFIIIIAIMLLGPDKIPDAMRTFGKFMASVKNASNEIKSEINKSGELNDLQSSIKNITNPIANEVEKLKSNIAKEIEIKPEVLTDINSETEKIKENFDDLTGPIKRQ